MTVCVLGTAHFPVGRRLRLSQHDDVIKPAILSNSESNGSWCRCTGIYSNCCRLSPLAWLDHTSQRLEIQKGAGKQYCSAYATGDWPPRPTTVISPRGERTLEYCTRSGQAVAVGCVLTMHAERWRRNQNRVVRQSLQPLPRSPPASSVQHGLQTSRTPARHAPASTARPIAHPYSRAHHPCTPRPIHAR